MKITIPSLLFILFALTLSGPAAAASWELDSSKDGIQVYARNKENSEVKDFKAVTELKAPIDQVVEVAQDVPSTPAWMSRLKAAEVIEESHLPQELYYFVWEVPWPFPDRDTVSFREVQQDPETGLVTIRYPAFNEYPDRKDRVRIHEFECTWLIRPIAENRTEVSLVIEPPPGGSLPAWMSNFLMKAITAESLQNLALYLHR